MYDGDKGRWFVPDPANQYWSGYVGMGNNPVSLVDPDGRDTWQNGSGENKYFEAGTDPGSGWTHKRTDDVLADINVTPQYSAHELTMMNPLVRNIHANTDQWAQYIAPMMVSIASFGTASTAISMARGTFQLYKAYSRFESTKEVGHLTPWSQMTKAEARAFQHSYSRHGSELGLPNWAQTRAVELQGLFNNTVSNIRNAGSSGFFRSQEIVNGVRTTVNRTEPILNGQKFYYYETLQGKFISAGKMP